jgi:hypothetical protein
MMAEVYEGLRIKDGAQTLPETLAKDMEVRFDQNVTFIADTRQRHTAETHARGRDTRQRHANLSQCLGTFDTPCI